MSFKLIISSLLIILYFNFTIIQFVRKEKLELKYSITWFVISLIMLLELVAFRWVENISKFMGIITPVNWIFLTSIIGLLFIVLNFTIELTKMSKQIKTIIQKLAITENINRIETNKEL